MTETSRGNGKTDAMLAKLATFPTLKIVAHGDRVADLIRRGVDRDRIVVIGTVRSACGHPQAPPTEREIKGCSDVIVRRCLVCERELWWNLDQWRKF